MNCREAEKRIYLYRELSPAEREETDAHLRTCFACRQIMEDATRTYNLARTTSPAPALSDPARMTRRIMDALPQSKLEKPRSLFYWSPVNALRYTMAGISVFLVFTFISEYYETPGFKTPAKIYRGAMSRIELNTASFHQAFLASKEKNANTAPLYECVVNCLQSQETVCADCGIKFSKPNHTP